MSERCVRHELPEGLPPLKRKKERMFPSCNFWLSYRLLSSLIHIQLGALILIRLTNMWWSSYFFLLFTWTWFNAFSYKKVFSSWKPKWERRWEEEEEARRRRRGRDGSSNGGSSQGVWIRGVGLHLIRSTKLLDVLPSRQRQEKVNSFLSQTLLLLLKPSWIGVVSFVPG